ncbi:hypothetical protein NG798_13830 [Ancylothrix sp. C2]|nr:hypothetical protein [Ancylothrix sp. D3o]
MQHRLAKRTTHYTFSFDPVSLNPLTCPSGTGTFNGDTLLNHSQARTFRTFSHRAKAAKTI